MKNLTRTLAAFALIAFVGCNNSPKSETERDALRDDGQAALKRMKSLDQSLDKLLKDAYGYAIFPSVGKGGLIVGGSYGRGPVYEQGEYIGHSDIKQATVGLQAGGQTFTELIVFQNKQAMDNFKYGKLKFAANLSAVALKSGAAESARYTDGVVVFVEAQGGLMIEASIGGQTFTFHPK